MGLSLIKSGSLADVLSPSWLLVGSDRWPIGDIYEALMV